MLRYEVRLFVCICLLLYLFYVLNCKFILIFYLVLEIILFSFFFFNLFIVFGCKWLKIINCKLIFNVQRVFLYILQVFVGGKYVCGYMYVLFWRMSSFGCVWCLEVIMLFYFLCMLWWYYIFIYCCVMINYYFVILIFFFEVDLFI